MRSFSLPLYAGLALCFSVALFTAATSFAQDSGMGGDYVSDGSAPASGDCANGNCASGGAGPVAFGRSGCLSGGCGAGGCLFGCFANHQYGVSPANCNYRQYGLFVSSGFYIQVTIR